MLYKNKNTNVGNTPSQRGLFATIQAMINSAISSIPSIVPAALSKTDDTNVTLTLGGSPTTALLQATSLTLGWTGTLADGRISSSANWNTAYTNRITSLTTTGSSGSATLSSNTLNIPTYTLSGLGGIGGSGVATRLAFYDSASTITSDSQFVWDNTNKWHGIGMTPIMKLQVSSSASSTTLPVAQLLRPNGTGASNKAIGYPYLLIGGGGEAGTLNVMTSIGFGYNYSNIYFPFVEIGSQTTSTSGYCKGDFWIATRSTTTNVAATERIRVLSSGETGFGTSTPNTASLVDITSTTKGFLPQE